MTGAFGAPLTAQLARPFFVLVRTLSFFRTVERVEALVVMLWIFPDFLITALFLWAGQYSLRLLCGFHPDDQPSGRKFCTLKYRYSSSVFFYHFKVSIRIFYNILDIIKVPRRCKLYM